MTDLYECKERPVPYVVSWAISCPICGGEIEYHPQEDDCGAFEFDPAEWPVCETCDAMIEPETVKISVVRTFAP